MKILLLGIGNIMFSDEGVGAHLSRLLKQKYRFSSVNHTIDIADGGTLAQLLAPLIAAYDYLIIFDCVCADNGEVGDVYFFDYKDMPNGVNWQGSAHEVEMLQTLSMMDLLGDRPTTKIIGVVPQIVEGTTLTMSEAIQNSAIVMEKTAIKHLEELGFLVETIDPNITIQQVADNFGKEL
ncbi:MAG: HyaD/HybD family hydrogenase maturation endopeptidase [Helicobacteraceae bacterium]|nr:HyaD/HybD family hydrogenase maturation endopeptidase [Helicobacteraceae bacterium]